MPARKSPAFAVVVRVGYHMGMVGRTPNALRPPPAEALDERARRVLAAIVQGHIEVGEPMGSHAIARLAEVDCSSATVRAVMADLEALGLLEKPHTSAGRVPTQLGYRYYVDALLRIKPPLPEERERIARGAQAPADARDPLGGVLASASRVLHTLTRHAGVVASPRPHSERLHSIELVQLREGRLLAVLVSQSGAVHNRLLAPRPGVRALEARELVEVGNYLGALLQGRTLGEARARLRSELEVDQRQLSELRARALSLGAEAMLPSDTTILHIEGSASLLEDKSLAQDLAKMRELFRALEEKERVLGVLDQALDARELRIFIGAESGIVEADLAVVAAPYRLKGEVVGALGVIGPTRMDYSRIVPLVELTARTLGLTLETDV